MHTHSTFSHDGRNTATEMLEKAQQMGVAFYGISEHFDYDYDVDKLSPSQYKAPTSAMEEEYFHSARHLQEDYEGVMNVAVGAEYGYSEKEEVQDVAVESQFTDTPDDIKKVIAQREKTSAKDKKDGSIYEKQYNKIYENQKSLALGFKNFHFTSYIVIVHLIFSYNHHNQYAFHPLNGIVMFQIDSL